MGYSIGSKIRYLGNDRLEYIAEVISYNYNNGAYYLIRPDGGSGDFWVPESTITGWA